MTEAEKQLQAERKDTFEAAEAQKFMDAHPEWYPSDYNVSMALGYLSTQIPAEIWLKVENFECAFEYLKQAGLYQEGESAPAEEPEPVATAVVLPQLYNKQICDAKTYHALRHMDIKKLKQAATNSRREVVQERSGADELRRQDQGLRPR